MYSHSLTLKIPIGLAPNSSRCMCRGSRKQIKRLLPILCKARAAGGPSHIGMLRILPMRPPCPCEKVGGVNSTLNPTLSGVYSAVRRWIFVPSGGKTTAERRNQRC